MDSLVSTDWLAAHLDDPELRLIDCSWYLPGDGRDARAEFAAAHLPGAVFWDLAALTDAASELPMMLPGADAAARVLAPLGLAPGTRVVLYDASPHHTAARGWASLRSYGVTDVALLDGGLAKWQAEGRPLAHGASAVPARTPQLATDHASIADQADVAAALADGRAQLVDARSPARFAGEEPEPRAGVVPGHMPGALNLHYATLFNSDGTWKRGDALAAAFAAAGVDLDRPVIATCGSGVTASVVAFGAHLLGREAQVYDGSWAEWGSDPATPKATGRA